ncbi:MAG: minor capsid protein [Thiothrix sp.]|nr:minor capsid protein [Thiothrix sp.]
MDKPDLAYALQLPPEEAVRYFQSKGLVLTKSWNKLWQAAHASAFTVAHLSMLDVLLDLFLGIQAALQTGSTERQFLKLLIPILQARGWWGKAIAPDTGEVLETYPGSNEPVQYGSPARLRLIYQQNMQMAYMAGRHQGLIEGAWATPFWQYVAVRDAATRPSHAALHGRVWRWDDPIWITLYPPNDWGCRCRVMPRSQRKLEQRGLTVESSADRLVTRTVPAGREPDGTQRWAEVTGIRTGRQADNGQEIVMLPGAGWSYNPGQAWQDTLADRIRERQGVLNKLTGTGNGPD